MDFQLVTLEGVKIDQEIYEVIMPTAAGEISVFPGHEALVSVAVPGVVQVRRDSNDPDDQMQYYAISGGIIEISQKRVRVLVDEADSGSEIVEAESQAALERAIKMRDSANDQVELEKAHQLVDRHAVRLKVAEIHRRRRMK